MAEKSRAVDRMCQRHENVGQGGVQAEPRQQTVTAVAPSSIAARAFDAYDVQGEFAKRS
jgi:hypothetical protein